MLKGRGGGCCREGEGDVEGKGRGMLKGRGQGC